MRFHKYVAILMVCIILAFVWGIASENEVEEKYSFDVTKSFGTEAYKRNDESSCYERLRKGLSVNMLVVGDSIGEGSGSSGVEHTWPALVSDYLSQRYNSEVQYTNVSMGGCASLCGYVRTNAVMDEKCYDLAIICYGQNDSEEDFGLYYESIIRALRAKYPEIDIICIQESAQREYTYKMKVIEEIAAHYECPVVDTIAPFSEDYDSLVADGIHPNDEGYKIYASEIEKTIDRMAEQRKPVNKKIEPYDDRVRLFDGFIWIPEKAFKRIEDSYVINLIGNIENIGNLEPIGSGTGPVVVIDIFDYNGTNSVMVYNNSVPVIEWASEWPYSFKQRHIPVISTGCVMNEGTIKIVLDTHERADDFEGIGFILGESGVW